MADPVEVVLDAHAHLGEGAIWHSQAQRLYWIDILAGKVHIYDPATAVNRTIDVRQPVGTVVPRRSGGLMLAITHGFASLNLDTEDVTILVDPEAHLPHTRFNDGKCDPSGRFWAGTMSDADPAVPHQGTLYMLDADHNVWPRLSNVSISNGIVWTADKKTMYFIDTLAHSLDAFDYDDATGEISNRRVMFTMDAADGFPDGMAIDSEDMLWIAVMGSSHVYRWDPVNAKLLETITLPTRQIASCAFGGPNLDELYITSGTIGLDAATLAREPLAGALFKVKTSVRGVPAVEYAG
jgi:sugar lactone lactonase YvrE